MPFQAGPLNLITDIDGINVGNATDADVNTGATAIIFDEPTVASCQILGGAPGTRDTEMLEPHNVVDAVDAIVLSGGSAFGLAASGGVQDWLHEQGRGLQVGPARVPIVPSAILFDLANGGNKDGKQNRYYHDMGYQAAAAAAGGQFAMGTVGAATGALTANLKGGLGSASTYLPGYEITIGACVAVNALGAATIGETPHFWAAPFELGDEYGGLGMPAAFPANAQDLRIKFRGYKTSNTTLGIIATDAKLSKAQCKRLAMATHDGFTRALWPSHTPFDGDIIFGASTCKKEFVGTVDEMIDLCAAASATMARAVARGVYEATQSSGDILPCWSQLR
ncbi:MAG: P1 family peptidase [Pseudomonadota bacterium]